MEKNMDTVLLLRQVNSGIQMGVHAIQEVFSKIIDHKLKVILESSMEEHQRLGNETHQMLNSMGEETTEGNPIAQGMSSVKTNVKMAMGEKDETAAGIISDGCHMGIKTLSQYLNQYKNAEEKAKDIAKKLISMEESLEEKMRCYL